MWHMHDVGWGWWFMGSLGMVALWALAIYALVWLVRGDRSGRPTQPPDEPPEKLLQRRLAAGEISVEEYERIRERLEDGKATAPHAAAVP